MLTNTNKSKQVVIIPHFVEYDYFYELYSAQFDILNVRTKDVKSFVDQLNKYKYVLSTSLHGLIISHAYGIPAIWIKHGWICSSEFKFHDYFSAVGIKQYDGFQNYRDILKSEERVIQFFADNINLSLVKEERLKEVQQLLIKSFPYNDL